MPATPSGVEFFQTLSEASQRYFFRQLVAALPQFRDGDSDIAQSRDKKAFTEVHVDPAFDKRQNDLHTRPARTDALAEPKHHDAVVLGNNLDARNHQDDED